jgi:serine/threonine protein kinase
VPELDGNRIDILDRSGVVIASHHWSKLPDAPSTHATCYYGETPDGAPVFVKRYHDAGDEANFRLTEEASLLRQVADCPNVIRLIGVGQTRTDEWCLVFEMADASLETQEHSEETAASVDRDIRAALQCLHARGLVHGDVSPNNIVRVGTTWKLIDFDNATLVGKPTQGQPKRERYAAPGRTLGDPAEPEFDLSGLNGVVEEWRDT